MTEESRVQRLEHAYRWRAPFLDDINSVSPWHILYREETWKTIKELCGAGTRVLDVGGGTGIFASRLARLGCQVVLLDLLPQMIDLMTAKLGDSTVRGRLRLVQGDVMELDQMNLGHFDVILCTQMLNFVEDRPRVFANLRQSIKSNGHLICDIDGAYRWAVIEMLAGRPENAIAILQRGSDENRAITGADYFFCSARQFMDEILDSGFRIFSSRGLQFFSSYLHVLAASGEFLDVAGLPREARPYTSEIGLDYLRNLESMATEGIASRALDMAAWIQVVADLPPQAQCH